MQDKNQILLLTFIIFWVAHVAKRKTVPGGGCVVDFGGGSGDTGVDKAIAGLGREERLEMTNRIDLKSRDSIKI